MTQQVDLVERINRIVRDRGDVELYMKLDRIMDQLTDEGKTQALGAVIKEISSAKTKKQTT